MKRLLVCATKGLELCTSHKGIGINQADYIALKKNLATTLEKLNVPQRERDEVMTFISSIEKNDIFENQLSSDQKMRFGYAPGRARSHAVRAPRSGPRRSSGS